VASMPLSTDRRLIDIGIHSLADDCFKSPVGRGSY
jgi:hypothetical protein